MTQKIEFDLKVKTNKMDEAFAYSKLTGKKAKLDYEDFLLMRRRSTKGGDDFRKATKKLARAIGFVLGHDNYCVAALKKFYESNGEHGLSEDEVSQILLAENFNFTQIDSLILEARQTIVSRFPTKDFSKFFVRIIKTKDFDSESVF